MSGFSVDGVLDALRVQPTKSAGGGRAIMLIGAQRGQGVTTAARAVAQAAGAATVYAIDLDLQRNALASSFGGDLGPRIGSALAGVSFYALVDSQKRLLRNAPESYFYHRVGRSRVFVGKFEQSAMPAGRRVWISDRSDYWDAARAGGATMVVDAPALERSQVGLRVARHMDGVVLLVGSGPGAAPAAMAAKASLIAAGANLMGLIYAGASAPVMALDRLTRKSA
jgi:hypothetical protein